MNPEFENTPVYKKLKKEADDQKNRRGNYSPEKEAEMKAKIQQDWDAARARDRARAQESWFFSN